MRPLSFYVTALQDSQKRKKRFAQISAALPEALDLLVVVMQAGLDFQVALEEYLNRAPKGPLWDEFSRLQAEIRTGSSRVQALRSLRARVPLPALQETMQTLIQGMELGSSLTPLLRTQAKALRMRRSLEAEKQAAVAPLKLMFPLFVFIFPTLFIALLGPVFLSMSKGGMP